MLTLPALSAPTTPATPAPAGWPSRRAGSFRPETTRDAALLDVPGGGLLKLSDTLTGYGRAEGYDSLANARRAAYQLTVGGPSPAAGIYRSGERFFVRALGSTPGQKPHVGADAGAQASAGALALLHVEGKTKAHFAWVRDSRLVLVVDGSTKIWSKDAHHAPPTAS